MPASASSEPRSEGRKTAVTDNYAFSKNNGHKRVLHHHLQV